MKHKALYTVFLRLDSSSRSLCKIALAQLSLKLIYSLGGTCSERDLRKQLREVLKTNIDSARISEALDQLSAEGKAKREKKQVSLRSQCRKKIDAAYDQYEKRMLSVLDKHFSKVDSPRENVRSWFEDVTTAFLEHHSVDWLSNVCGSLKYPKRYQLKRETFLNDLYFEQNKIDQDDREWLSLQYMKFVESLDPQDNELLYDFGTSAFSSILISSSIAVDHLSADAFRDAVFILDTNILIDFSLEAAFLWKSVKSMEQIFRSLNITTGYFYNTKFEYEKKMQSKKEELLNVVEKYKFSVLQESTDEFIETALMRGCANRQDFERFIDNLLQPPKELYENLPLKCLDFKELNAAIAAGEKDNSVITALNDIFMQRHNFPKREKSLRHDAGMIAGAQFLKGSRKCWILTRDGTVIEHAIGEAVRDEYPLAVCIYTLINILAIDNGGVDVDPSNFSPLYAAMVKRAIMPDRDTFQVEDLAYMLDTQVQISKLSDKKVIGIAKRLNKSRMSGMDKEKLSLQLTREFQEEKLKMQDDLHISEVQRHLEQTRREEAERASAGIEQVLREQYTKGLRDKYDKKLFWNRVVAFFVVPIVSIALTAYGISIYYSSWFEPWSLQITGLCVNLLLWILTGKLLINPKIVSLYSERVQEIERQADEMVKRARDRGI